MASRWIIAGVGLALLVGGCPDRRPPGYFEAPPVPSPLEPASAPDAAAAFPDDGAERSRDLPADTRDAPDAAADSGGPSEDAAARPGAAWVPSFVGLFERLSPSVVNIYTQEVVRQRLPTPFAPPATPELGTSLGSGVVIDTSGSIITNAHVVENAAEIRVRFHDDDEQPARLVGIDPVRDLALLEVDPRPGLRPVVPGDSDTLAVGDWVIAIGNPFGLSHTLTKGIVSAKGRAEFINDRVGYLDLIQTDAAINEGSSGGPLFNLAGEVVGVTAAVSAQGQGIGFVIPWNAVRDALPRLRQGGQVSRSWLGIFARPAEDGADGVLVQGVVDDSPASRAGIVPGDLVVELDGRPVRSAAEFRLQVASGVAGRDLPVRIQRSGKELRLSVRLEEARDVR